MHRSTVVRNLPALCFLRVTIRISGGMKNTNYVKLVVITLVTRDMVLLVV
jgi:hypothetical protein